MVRSDCQMNRVLDVGAENVMSLHRRRQADGDESKQEPSRTNSLPPGRERLEVIVHAKLSLQVIYSLFTSSAMGKMERHVPM